MGERVVRNGFEDIKLAAIQKAKEDGENDPVVLARVGEDAKRAEMFRIGRESEERFGMYVKSQRHFRYVLDGTHEEDIVHQVDKWLGMEPGSKLPDELPVQIKSSWKDVNAFKLSSKFRQRKGIFFVFNCGPSITQQDFDKQFKAESDRIRTILGRKKKKK